MEKKFESLKDTKSFKYGDTKYYVGKIPVFYAQRILLAAGDALKDLNLTLLPEAVILELLSYSAVENVNGNPIVLDGIEIVNEMISDPKFLIALELKIIEENFGFFFDGSLREVFQPIAELLTKSVSAAR